jgi:hypothetical protein
MRHILYCFLFLFFLIGKVYAENAIGIGWGVFTCYEFLHPSRDEDFRGRDMEFMNWAQGYMSAKNLYSRTNISLKYDLKEQIVILKIYCEEHKRDMFYLSVENLYEELSKKGKQEK